MALIELKRHKNSTKLVLQNLLGILNQGWASHRVARTPSHLIYCRGDTVCRPKT